LHRLPVTEWIGFEAVNHHATDGIAIGECWLYDEQGATGTATVAALAQRKPMPKLTRPSPKPRSSCPAKAGHPVFQKAQGKLKHRGVLDRPPKPVIGRACARPGGGR
jgi:hypothetical protein